MIQPSLRQRLANRRIAVMLPLGFASGLPLALTAGTLQAWLTVTGVDLKTIGLFTLVGLPYTLKFLWSPVMDRFAPPWLGRRRGWMVSAQAALLAGIIAMAVTGPEAPWSLAALALLVAFVSASQDIAFDAYRADLLQATERGFGAAVSVTGYRIGMLAAGAVALILAERIGWRETYLLMAGLMGLGLIATLLGPDPPAPVQSPRSLADAIRLPLREFFTRRRAVELLLVVVLYKIGDALAGALTTAFLIRGLGFSPTEVGVVNKGMGLAATIVGALVGGALMARWGLIRSLLGFGALQALSNLSFMLLAWSGKSYALMVGAVAIENLSGGMGTAAFVALMMSLCDHRYTATQFALLSALAAVGRVAVGPPSGYLVEQLGWGNFFLVSTAAALPGLWLLRRLRETLGEPGTAASAEATAVRPVMPPAAADTRRTA
jgi:PAT family beta-lactamase induction signal transducer AmpG